MISDDQMNALLNLACEFSTAEDDDPALITDYSGRCMYGKTCPAIVTGKPIELIEEAAINGIRGAVMDSMGLDAVVYWPNL